MQKPNEIQEKYNRYQRAVEVLNELSEKDNEAPQLNPTIVYLKQQRKVIAQTLIDATNILLMQVDSPEFITSDN